VRVSFVGGRSGDRFHADEEQVATIKRYAQELGAEVEFMPPELSVSGGKPIQDRPALLAAIEGVEAGRYDGIVVAYLSRLTRSRSGIDIWNRVEAAGGHVHCAAERLDTSTANGRFVRDIHLANAVREREEHVDRFEARRMHATAAGVWQRRQTPTGYVRDPGTRKLVPDSHADEVRQAFTDRANGVPVVQIADRLAMTSSGVRQMLANRVYLGELKVGEHVNPAAHDPLVTVEDWEAAQVTVARPTRGVIDGPALLAGIARCAGCGHVMSRTRAKAVVYACGGRSSGGRCPAPATVTLRLLDEHVEPIALGQLRQIALSTAARDDTDVTTARDDVAAATRELNAYMEAVSADDVGVDAFRAAARSRRERVEEAQARLQRALAVQPAVPAVGDVDAAWGQLDAHGRNAVLRGLLEVVVVRRGGGRGSRTPLRERVRIIEAGTGLIDNGRQTEIARGIRPIDLPDFSYPGVLGELG
jgi:DNA invertase Pin-like site-specific DNA recombinase